MNKIMKLQMFGFLLFMVILLGACSNTDANPPTDQLEDMELVVSAQQGRIQILEKNLADLEAKLAQTTSNLESLTSLAGQDTVDLSIIASVEDQNKKLVRLLFQTLTSEVDMEALSGLIDTYETVYKMLESPDGTYQVLWITDGGPVGELYTLKKENKALQKLGSFSEVSLVKWSPDSKMLIVETKFDNKHKGYLLNALNGEEVASMEYTGLPLWSDKSTFFVYLNTNPNVVYTGTETAQMHTSGVFLYTVSTGKFTLLDPGGVDYLCQDLSIDGSGEIKYVRQFKDGKQSFSSVKID